MRKKDLLDFDEEKLPNVSLDRNQKNRIRRSLFKNIKRFNENNYELSIDDSIENLKLIEDKLGDEKNDIVHGVKHAKVLKELALQAVFKDCPLNKSNIIYENFFQIGYGMEAKDATYSVMYSTFYCYIFISKDFLVTYSFDNFYRLQYKHVIKLQDIKYVKVSNRDCDGIKLSRDNLIISIDRKAKEQVSNLYLVNSNPEKDDITDAKRVFVSLGVTESNLNFNYSLRYYLHYFLWVLFALYVIFLILSVN